MAVIRADLAADRTACPVLPWAADTTAALALGQELARIGAGPLFVLPDLGHIPQMEDPAAFQAALTAALAAIGKLNLR